MFTLNLIIFILTYLFGVSVGQIVQTGQCDPNRPLVANFDINSFLGTWHQISSYPTESSTGTCIKSEFSYFGGDIINILNTEVIAQSLSTISGTAIITHADRSGNLAVTLNVAPNVQVTQDLLILATDYTNYAITYSCVNISPNEKRLYSWILSRTRQLSPASQAVVDQVIDSITELQHQYYVQTDQSAEGCFYSSEQTLVQPVQFRGQCDNNIPAVMNFSPEQFMGLWHTIEKYPTPSQSGSCSNSLFTSRDNILKVVNTQVVNETLETSEGTAVIVSTDGSAKLALTLPIAGTDATITTEYWILSTDYSSYALVYSCVNINEDIMQVSSWKLSRMKTLTMYDNWLIDQVIASINVLDQRYFQQVDQSTAGCFYFPEPQPGVPVVFPGQCEDPIGVKNLDFALFQGIWHEISSYPVGKPTGQCISHMFTASNTTMNVVSSSVTEEALVRTNAVISTGSNGMLIITITDSFQSISLPLWILDVDYTHYALAYSCINQSSDSKTIWSWQLSRTRSLSPQAEIDINNAIGNIDVLNQRYYEPVDQTDEACFFLPEIQPGEPVIFPGHCDNSIETMADLDINRLLGRWIMIESYDIYEGTCNELTFSVGLNGSFVVTVTQVVNQTLVTMTGSAEFLSNGILSIEIPTDFGTLTSWYWILDTDYAAYALVYSCINVSNDVRRVSSWKLSRSNSLSNAANTAINNVINSINVLDHHYYLAMDQSNYGCFHYPEPDFDAPAVIFPGQCDPNVPVVQNFDVASFMGLWYNIESYPSPFLTGGCNTVEYTLNNGSISIKTSQVVNNTLDTWVGSAVVTSYEGSAKLDVTFNVHGFEVTTNYWIIATDYNSYALVYSCVNLGPETRAVWSWQLSRWQSLSTQAELTIKNAIGNIDVLNQRYYRPVNQTDEACFFLPAIQPGEPVIFPGQCDNSIEPMANLDVNRLLGGWTIIESYDMYGGTCNELTFSLGLNGSFIVTVTQVVNQTLETITGSAEFLSSGILSIEIPTDFGTLTSLYWILDTDYESYALVYSCINVSNDGRRVSSWKLSRSKSLSDAANTAMNNVINSINVLNHHYYLTLDQSNDSCFHHPEPDVDAPAVIFPGQCDPNVPVVPNFDVARYLGLWYNIESYPSPFLTGGCNTAEYTLNNGSISIKTSQVVNHTLETWVGSAVMSSNDGSAKLDVTFNVNGFEVTSNYWVIATDYVTYALVYSCVNLDPGTKAVYSWKLSRTPSLTALANTVINQVIDYTQVLDQKYYIPISHAEEDCIHYDDGDIDGVLLPGQCLDDGLVPAVHYFNPALFAGTWYEVSRYPSGIQKGDCDSSNFILSGPSGFNVTHTTVYNQTQQNTATQATAPNGGRGIINASIGGVPFSNVFILTTDYREYALAYACRNVKRDTKQIYSWKLSRSRSGLSDFASTVIDHVVSNNQDLFEGYYQTTHQDDDSCPHYSWDDQTQVPPSVEFPGQCREIHGVPNFDATAYLGTWYETARYSTPSQIGQCSRVKYTLSQQLVVSKTEVFRQTLRNQTGVVGIANDGSGLLNLIINDNGVTWTSQQYILATDYTSYALVYSCINLNNQTSRVTSWKLSRTPTLSPEASAAMSPVIATTWSLSEVYYQPTSQSDQDCFYVSS